MTDFSLLTNSLSMLIEMLGVLYFYRNIPAKSENRHTLAGCACLLLLIFIYVPLVPMLNSSTDFSAGNLLNQVARTSINWLAIYGYLSFTKEKPSGVSAYLAALYVLIYMVSFNLRQACRPLLSYSSPEKYEYIMLFLIAFFQWLTVIAAHELLDLNSINNASGTRWGIICIAVLVELYFKWSLIAPDTGYNQRPIDIIFYSLCATIGIFALVILVERNIAYQEKRAEMQMERLQMQFEMQNAKRALRANTDIRRLYHDMKNHLIAIQAMVDAGGETNDYVSELCTQLEEYECNVNTGNSVADSLLAEKMQRARLDGISFNICADLTPFSFISSVDMVTILGNATDNAVEALQMLPEGTERVVYIKTARYANMAVLRISNQFAGKLSMEDGVLKTAKSDTKLHGIGLSSIKKAAKHYDGNVETQFENEGGWFRLIIMIPIPE